MVKLKRGKRLYGPSSSLGIVRFFDSETKAPKMSPEFFVAFAAIAIIAIIIAKVTLFA